MERFSNEENKLKKAPESVALEQAASEFETPTSEALNLQQMIGNQGVQRLFAGNTKSGATSTFIQAKMSVTPADDKYEQEADKVAAQVVQQMPLQRQAMEEEEPLQAMRIQRVEEEEPLQGKRIQRVEEEELQAMRVQRAGGGEGFDVSSGVEDKISAMRGGGQKLADGVRGGIEGSMGYDFSGVNVHTGNEANQLTQALQARAFTTGKDIFFGEGEYQPENKGGQELLAHELTHVVQQGSAQPKRKDED